jgi:hypothetical protein
MKVEVKISKYSEAKVIIEVKKPLYWSDGTPYTFEDYAITAEVERDAKKDIKVI